MGKAYLTKEQIRLLRQSEFIKGFPKIKDLVDRYDKITDDELDLEKDLDNNLIQDLKNKEAIDKIIKNCVKEWYPTGNVVDLGKKRMTCSLCGNTNNEFIHYIANKANGIKMNVGSTCIEKFTIYGGFKGVDTSSKAKKEATRVLNKFELDRYIQGHGISIKDIKAKYKSFPILLPTRLNEDIVKTISSFEKLYDQLLNNSDRSISSKKSDKFKYLYSKVKELLIEANQFLEENKDKLCICTKEIAEFIVKQYPNNCEIRLKKIRDNNALLPDKMVRDIYEQNLIYKLETKIKSSIENGDYCYLKLDKKAEHIEIYDQKDPRILLNIPVRELMRNHATTIINNESISSESILKMMKLSLNTDKKYLIKKINEILSDTNFQADLFTRELNGVRFKEFGIFEYENEERKYGVFRNYVRVDLDSFFNIIFKHLINNNKDQIKAIIKSNRNWKSYKELEKYNFQKSRI